MQCSLHMFQQALIHIVTDRPWVQQVIVFIDNTDKKVTTLINTTLHQNFKNHSQQIILYPYIQYYRPIAQTPVSNTVLHRFASPLCNTLCSSDEHSLSAMRNILSRCEKTAPPAEHWSYMPLMSFSNKRLCNNQSSGSVWYSASFS